MKLTISTDGYVSVQELLQHSQFRGYTLAQVEECIAKCEKQRFQLKTEESGEMFVRATQGHSIAAVKDDQLLELIEDPTTVPTCLHGTYAANIESIKRTGLNKMRRNNIHLIACLPEEVDGVVSGMRKTADTIVTINMAGAMAAGIPFYRSSNGVILSPGLGDTGCIPPEFIGDFLRRPDAHQTIKSDSERNVERRPAPIHNVCHVDTSNIPCDEVTQPAFTHYCVIDFEATCLDSKVIQPQEIIEFPAVMLSAITLQPETEFHSYVRPLYHPTLSKFCTELTGIAQSTVDEAPDFTTVYHMFTKFLEDFENSYREAHNGQEPNVLYVSHGDWDFRTMLPSQCKTSSLKVLPALTRWMNVKVLYTNSTAGNGKKKGMGMEKMLADLGLELQGRHHSGIDDSRNIARILVDLVSNRGAVPVVTGGAFGIRGNPFSKRGRGGSRVDANRQPNSTSSRTSHKST